MDSLDNFLAFFADMASWQKLAWLLTVLVFCWVLERLVPLADLKYRKWKHAGVNFVFLGFTMVINFAFGFLILMVCGWTGTADFGLLAMLDLPTWGALLVTVLALDFFAQYVSHYMLHHIPVLFKFHRIHHSDTKVDATTGTRHHPGDFVVREIMSVFVVLLLGAPLSFYVFYRMLTVFFGYTSHANIKFPRVLDRTLGWILITPNIHKFHHHEEQHWTDTNFGNIFSFWDRIFGTLVIDDPNKVVYGLDIMDGSRDEDIGYQLKSPFDSRIQSPKSAEQ
jgi:sterol desaturase/sphingolipid hydroxylase (fatty acid hydroxylase superfamily)